MAYGKLLEDRCSIDDRDEIMQASQVAKANSGGLVAEGEGLGDGQRLRYARRFDEHMVEALLRC